MVIIVLIIINLSFDKKIKYDYTLKGALCSITNNALTNLVWALASLPIEEGGSESE